MFKKGFTLAETMIALGIVGILAAVTIPVITKVAPNNNKVMFKKAYYTLERAVTYLINNDTNYPASQLSSGGVVRGFNYTTATTNGTENKFCNLLSDTMNVVGPRTCFSTSEESPTNIASFTSSDGILWKIYIPTDDVTNNSATAANQILCGTASQFSINSTCYSTKVFVDVNGSKTPNCTRDTERANYTSLFPNAVCNGTIFPDQFLIGVRYDGRLMVGYSNNASPTTITDQNAIDILQAPTNNTK